MGSEYELRRFPVDSLSLLPPRSPSAAWLIFQVLMACSVRKTAMWHDACGNVGEVDPGPFLAGNGIESGKKMTVG